MCVMYVHIKISLYFTLKYSKVCQTITKVINYLNDGFNHFGILLPFSVTDSLFVGVLNVDLVFVSLFIFSFLFSIDFLKQ